MPCNVTNIIIMFPCDTMQWSLACPSIQKNRNNYSHYICLWLGLTPILLWSVSAGYYKLFANSLFLCLLQNKEIIGVSQTKVALLGVLGQVTSVCKHFVTYRLAAWEAQHVLVVLSTRSSVGSIIVSSCRSVFPLKIKTSRKTAQIVGVWKIKDVRGFLGF